MRFLVKTLLSRPEMASLVVMVILGLVFYLVAPVFLSAGNFRVLFSIIPELGLVTLGVALLMISGEFDLSVGSVFALGGIIPVVLVKVHGWDPWVALAVATSAGVAIGYFNAFVTLTFHIPSFVTTLGMLFIARSLAVVFVGGFPPPWPRELPEKIFIGTLVEGGLVRAQFLWFAGVAVILGWVLHRSNFGNWIFATGAHRQSAQDMGVNTGRVKTVCFMICSVLAIWAGYFQTLRVHSALANTGVTMELQAIAACVIGGMALFGGIGSILGAIVGAFIIRMLDSGLIMAGVDANWFRLTVGLMLIGSVVLNIFIRRRAQRMRLRDEARAQDDRAEVKA